MFIFIIRFVTAAVLTFTAINIFSPIIYRLWFEQLRPMNEGYERLQQAGDLMFSNFLILSWVVAGLIIVWGIVVAQRKRVNQTYEEV